MNYKTVVLLIISIFNLFAQIEIDEKEIDEGIVHKRIINSEDTLIINILQVDLTKGNYTIESLKADDLLKARETTSKMAETFNDSLYRVIAAINADFFEADGEVINNMVSGGEFVKAVKFTDTKFNPFVNTQFAITFDNRLLMEQFVFSGYIILPDGTHEQVNRINSRIDSSSVSLYNSYQGKFTPDVPDTWYNLEFVLKPIENKSDTLKFIVDKISKTDNMEIREDEYILSCNNSYAYYFERELTESDTVQLILKFNPDHKGIKTLVGGWPRIVHNGKNIITSDKKVEGIFNGFSETKHPRSGVGFSKDSSIVYFITVDGRQETSRGMSLKEFADLLISEGVYHALNLDGGGSTAMIIQNKIVNSPSDLTGEREVSNCLVLLKRKD
ncbi:MAG: phosphodiester glycosidase family protein [Ignavibacteriales bacterium]|nr:MAG: phosphodiester glycosidase family protein [Ignavibacteriales bacterium]